MLDHLSKARIFCVNNFKISISYYSKYSLLTHSYISQLLLCWFDWAPLESPPDNRLSPYLLHISSHSTIWADGAATVCDVTEESRWSEGVRENTPPRSLCSKLSHWHFHSHSIGQSNLIYKAKSKVNGVEMYTLPARKYQQVTWKNQHYVITRAEQKRENNNSVLPQQPYLRTWKKFRIHTKFTKCTLFIGNILTVEYLSQSWLHST